MSNSENINTDLFDAVILGEPREGLSFIGSITSLSLNGKDILPVTVLGREDIEPSAQFSAVTESITSGSIELDFIPGVDYEQFHTELIQLHEKHMEEMITSMIPKPEDNFYSSYLDCNPEFNPLRNPFVTGNYRGFAIDPKTV